MDAWGPGFRVDDYEIEAPLGEGGMGLVYRARHTATGGTYALKTLRVGDPESMLRFQREGEAQARVDAHANVVRVHASGQAHGRAYLVMDLASGGDLQARLGAGGLEPRRAAQIARDLARGLAHVHARGVLHRDLKPSNVLFDDSGAPQLVDFGVAALQGAKSLTQSGAVVGSPAYMAPEQAEGRHDDVDERTDVYGLGAVLYAALTGEPPFSARSVVGLLKDVVYTEPVPPSKRATVPDDLDAICLRALSKDPAKRPASASAFARELEVFLAGASQHPGGRVFPSVVLTAVALLVVAIGFALATGSSHPAAPQPASRDRSEVTPTPAPASEVPTAEEIADLERGGVAGFRACERFLRRYAGHPSSGRAAVRRKRIARRPLTVVSQGSGRQVFFTGDGERFVVRSHNDRVGAAALALYELDGTQLWQVSLPRYTMDMAYDDARGLLGFCGYGGDLQIRALASGERTAVVDVRGALFHMALAPDGEHLVVGGEKSVFVFRWPSVERVASLESRDRQLVVDIEFSATGTLYVASKGSGQETARSRLEVFDSLEGPPVHIEPLVAHVSLLGPAHVGDAVGVGYGNGGISLYRRGSRLLNLPQLEGALAIQSHPDKVADLAFGPDDAQLYSTSNSNRHENNDVRRWTLEEPIRGARALPGNQHDRFRALDVSPDGSLLLITRLKSVELWAIDGLWADR